MRHIVLRLRDCQTVRDQQLDLAMICALNHVAEQTAKLCTLPAFMRSGVRDLRRRAVPVAWFSVFSGVVV